MRKVISQRHRPHITIAKKQTYHEYRTPPASASLNLTTTLRLHKTEGTKSYRYPPGRAEHRSKLTMGFTLTLRFNDRRAYTKHERAVRTA